VGTVSPKSEAASRSVRMLRTAMGPAITAWLEDPAVVEVMLNPDGRLWIDRLAEGLADTGKRLAAADGERIVRLVAHHVGAEVHPGSPRVSAELPETGERFEGLIPPIVAAPDRRLKDVVPTRLEAFDDRELDQLAFRAAPRQNRNEVDGFCNQRPRDGDDRSVVLPVEVPPATRTLQRHATASRRISACSAVMMPTEA
jgi:hypothetical protein